MNKYMHLSEFEEMLNKKKIMIEDERRPIQEARRPQPSQRGKRNYAIGIASSCILVALVAGGAFLRVENKIGGTQSVAEAAVKDIGTLKARMATDTTKEQIAAIKAHVDALQVAKMQLEGEVEQIKNIVETAKNRANNSRGTGTFGQGAGQQLPRAENKRYRL